MKNVEVQTPDLKKLRPQDFITPVKSSRLLSLREIKNMDNIQQNLFSYSSEKEGDSGSKSERKLTPSSENSIIKKSGSGINTSDLKCSENLASKKQSIQDENVNINSK